MRVRAAALAGLFGVMVSHSVVGAAEEALETLPLELLEFLADWQDEDGAPIDPLMLDDEPETAPEAAHE